MFSRSQEGAPSRRVRVLLVDDNPLFLEVLATVLGLHERIEVVGTAGDGAEATELAQDLRPEVVLMDVHMPKMDGFEATRRIRRSLPSVRIVIVTSSSCPADVAAARAAGAEGYGVKRAPMADLTRAVLDPNTPFVQMPAVRTPRAALAAATATSPLQVRLA